MKKNYFRWLSIIFVAALCLGFTSCGGDDDNSSLTNETDTNYPTASNNFYGQLYYSVQSYQTMEAYVREAESTVTTVTIPEYIKLGDKVYNVTSIGAEAFKGCNNLTSVIIPNSVTSIGYGAFEGCSSLTSIIIPNNVTAIRGTAFKGCSSLTEITIPNSVTEIGDDAFYNCSSLTSVTIHNGVKSIGWCAFKNCSSLTSVTIPNSVKTIENFTFQDCSSLTLVTIPNSVTSIKTSAFCDCSNLTSVTIPNSVTSIGDYAFCRCSSLTSITIPNSVTSIGSDAFYGCIMGKDEFINNSSLNAEANRYWGCDILDSSKDGLCIKNGVLLKYIGLESSIIIPNSVTSIKDYAFADCSSLKSVTIPNSVTSIENHAFKGCSNLTKIELNSNDLVSKTYSSYSNIKKTFGTQVKEYIIGESVTSIGDYAFYGCSDLTSVKIGNGVKSIGDFAFSSCSSLTSVTIPNSVTAIGDHAFSSCDGLTSVKIGNGVKSIGDFAFSSCDGLTSVTIPNRVTSIGDGAFDFCTSLKSITIPNSVTAIGSGAFYETAWYNNQPDGLIYAGKVAYEYKLDHVSYIPYLHINLKEGTLGIASHAFHNDFIGLRVITIPNSVTTIGECAFSNCPYLTDIYCYAQNVPTTGSYTFNKLYIRETTLHVPAASINAYKTKDPWSGFKSIVAL